MGKEFSLEPIETGPDTQTETVEAGLRSIEALQEKQDAPSPEVLATNKKIALLEREIIDLRMKVANSTFKNYRYGKWVEAKEDLETKNKELQKHKDSLDLSKAGGNEIEELLDGIDPTVH